MRDDVVGLLIELISSSESLHSYAACQLWLELVGDLISKQPLVQVSMWTIGEFADLLAQSGNSEDLSGESVDAHQIIDKCEELLSSIHMTLITKEYTLNALTKLSVRFPSEAARVKELVDFFGCSHSIELQQRAVEFATLFSRHDQLRPNVYEKMPQMSRNERRVDADSPSQDDSAEPLIASTIVNSVVANNSSSALLDLLDMSPTHNIAEHSKPIQADTLTNLSVANDALLDLLGSLDSNNVAPQTNSIAKPNDLNSLDTIFGAVHNSALPSIPVVNTNGNSSNETSNNLFDSENLSLEPAKNELDKIPSITAYEKNGLRLDFNFEKSPENPLLILITLIASNSNGFPIEDFLFQAAVPKVT